MLPQAEKSGFLADLLPSCLLLLGGLAAFAALSGHLLALQASFWWHGTAVFAVACLAVILLFVRWGGARFGAANRITLLRLALLAPVAAALGESFSPGLSWFIVLTTTLALFLDGIDGRIARRSGSASDFGARFDMETDAATILILSVLCWRFDKAGAWIIAAGAMRYVFVVAAFLLPWMQRALPYSRRRQAVCILQAAGLLAVISPVFQLPLSSVLAAATLVMLGTSFAADVRWLWEQRGQDRPSG